MIKIFPTIQIKELDAYTIENGARFAGSGKSHIRALGSGNSFYGICRTRQQWGRRAGCFASAGRAGIPGGGISL